MPLTTDNLRWIVRSEQLILSLKERGVVQSPAIEDAFRLVPRHHFLPDEPIDVAYADAAVPIQEGRGQVLSSASAPSVVAAMLEQLEVQPGQRILEIGTGTGFNAALLAQLVGSAGHIVTLEIDRQLARLAVRNLRAVGSECVQVVRGDGIAGYPPGAPYDRIVLTVGTANVADAWLDQLAPDGLLLLPLWFRGEQLTVVFENTPTGLVSRSIQQHGFVRLRGRQASGERMVASAHTEGLAFSVETRGRKAASIDSLLNQPGITHTTTMILDPRDARAGLIPWLAFHDVAHCLILSPKHVETIPGVYTEGQWKLTSGSALDGHGAALGLPDPSAAGALLVKSFGASSGISERLLAEVTRWDAAGRPLLDNLTLRLSRKREENKIEHVRTLQSGIHLNATWRSSRVTRA